MQSVQIDVPSDAPAPARTVRQRERDAFQGRRRGCSSILRRGSAPGSRSASPGWSPRLSACRPSSVASSNVAIEPVFPSVIGRDDDLHAPLRADGDFTTVVGGKRCGRRGQSRPVRARAAPEVPARVRGTMSPAPGISVVKVTANQLSFKACSTSNAWKSSSTKARLGRVLACSMGALMAARSSGVRSSSRVFMTFDPFLRNSASRRMRAHSVTRLHHRVVGRTHRRSSAGPRNAGLLRTLATSVSLRIRQGISCCPAEKGLPALSPLPPGEGASALSGVKWS